MKIDIRQKFITHCQSNRIKFREESSVLSYDDSTLFCPAGMQQFKNAYKNTNVTHFITNIQPCIRLNDFSELGDGTHLAYFNMLGMFGFNTNKQPRYDEEVVKFWLEFCLDMLGISLSKVTVHPEDTKFKDIHIGLNHDIPIVEDTECYWSDGEIGGYCTEFYTNYKGKEIELGNIVNTLGKHIDVGFGMERLDMVVNDTEPKSRVQILQDTALKIIESNVAPSNKQHGYVLRKILREIYKLGGTINHPYFIDECNRQDKNILRYNRLKDKHQDKSPEWWMDTHGVDINLI